MLDVEPAGQYTPAATAPPLQEVQEPEPAPKDVLDTVCEALTVYVPAPPEPVPSAVMVVAKATPAPLMVMPTARVPEEIAVTVSVVAEIAPVKDAARLKDPWAQRTQ